MAVSSIVVFGYGSFGAVNRLPTLGYYMPASIAPGVPGIELTAPDDRPHFSATSERLHFTARLDRLHLTIEEQ